MNRQPWKRVQASGSRCDQDRQIPHCADETQTGTVYCQEPEAQGTVRAEGCSLLGMTSLRCLRDPSRDLKEGSKRQRSKCRRKGLAADGARNLLH